MWQIYKKLIANKGVLDKTLKVFFRLNKNTGQYSHTAR